jgi:hypothetical protein
MVAKALRTEHHYVYPDDPYPRTPDDEQYHQHQYGDEDMESEEDLGFIQPEWRHVLTVDDLRLRRTRALCTNRRSARSSVGSRSQASQVSPGACSVGSIPPVPPIPPMYRHDTT